MNQYDVVEVANALYREKNPNTKMDTPSSVYEIVEKWKNEWMTTKTPLSLYKWIKLNKDS